MFKNDDGSLTRRELLAALARTGMVAPLALGSAAFAAQTPRAPTNVKIMGATEINSAKALITPADLKFLGYIRLSKEAGELWYSPGTLALRRVGNQARFFTQGNDPEGSPILEFAVPDASPHPDLASAPQCQLVRNWGTLLSGRTLTGGSGWRPGGLHWDEARKAVWWTYGDNYVPTQSHPTIGCSMLNDAAGTAVSYGPWRTQWTSQTTRGGLCKIPDYFASAYTSGKAVGVTAGQSSGNASSPFGAALSALSLPDPTSTPADVLTNTHWTIGNHGLIMHDINHRQARDTKYKTCGWRVLYDCKAGSDMLTPPPLFGGVDPAAGESDTMGSVAWIDLPDKHGLLYFGQLVTTPVGYTAPGDPDGLVHMWYGDPFRSDGSKPQTCCHGQDDPFWGATGPGAHYRVPMGWIYNPNDLVVVAQGKADLWSRVPVHTFQWQTYVPALAGRFPNGMWGGSVFDAPTRRLYTVIYNKDNVTAPPNARPVIMAFEIR
jgi:hypothetical protein